MFFKKTNLLLKFTLEVKTLIAINCLVALKYSLLCRRSKFAALATFGTQGRAKVILTGKTQTVASWSETSPCPQDTGQIGPVAAPKPARSCSGMPWRTHRHEATLKQTIISTAMVSPFKLEASPGHNLPLESI